MKDMLEVLKRARQKKIFANQEFQEMLMQIQSADATLKIDWDIGAGEEWARFSNQENEIVCMINRNIGLIFIRSMYEFQNIEHVIGDFEVVFTENYWSEDWTIDTGKLKDEVPEIHWHACEGAVNPNCFSLDDFYYATV